MRGRPAGDLSRALMGAAAAGPATVRELAERACVGYGAARYTASRLVSRGDLVCVSTERPVLLGLEQWQPDGLSRALEALADAGQGSAARAPLRSFWEEAGSAAAPPPAVAALAQRSSADLAED